MLLLLYQQLRKERDRVCRLHVLIYEGHSELNDTAQSDPRLLENAETFAIIMSGTDWKAVPLIKFR